KNRTEGELALSSIYWSVMEGDFGRYVIGTNSASFRWSSRRLGDKKPRTKREKYEAFVSTLDTNQQKIVTKLRDAISATRQFRFDESTGKASFVLPKGASEKVNKVRQELVESLGKNKTKLFVRNALPFLLNQTESRDVLMLI